MSTHTYATLTVSRQSFEEIYGPPENFLEIEVSYSIFQPCAGLRTST